MKTHSTDHSARSQRIPAQRDADDTASLTPEKYRAAVAVGRIEARFPGYHRQLAHLENILGAFRAKVVALEIERREVLARMQQL